MALLLLGDLRGDFVSTFFSFVVCFRAFTPLAALRIFSLAFSDGRFEVDEVGWEARGFDGDLVVALEDVLGRIAAFTFVLADLTFGSLTVDRGFDSLAFACALGAGSLPLVTVFLDALDCTVTVVLFAEVFDLETDARALDTAFLTPFAMEFGARSLRFLFRCDEDLSSAVPLLRFVPVTFLVVVDFFVIELFF